MIRFALVMLVTGITASAFVGNDKISIKPVLAYDDGQTSGAIDDGRLVYQVVSASGFACTITSIVGLGGAIRVEPEKACDGVVDGLGTVSQWISGERGNFLLKNADGEIVLMIQPSDGFAYEATSDENVQISLQIAAR